MMDWGHAGTGGAMMTLGVILGLALLIGTVVVVVTLLAPRDASPAGGQDRGAPPEPGESRSPAETELELRYARGEIDASALVEGRAVLHARTH